MSYLTVILDRVVAIQKEAMTAQSVTADAAPYFFFTGEAFPYFTNRIDDIGVTGYIEGQEAEDIDLNMVVVVMRFVVGHITSGAAGERESDLYEYLPGIKTYFQEREMLQSAAYPFEMDGILGARVFPSGGGLRAFQNAGITVVQVGSELRLAVRCIEGIEQVYL